MDAYFELSFELGAAAGLQAAEAACLASGALAVTLCDARDEPVLEPGPGQIKLWRATRVQALYAAERAGAQLILELAARLGLAPQRLTARAIPGRVWEREWLRDFHAMRFGERLWVSPRHEQVGQPGAVVVRLDPGLAFGTGTHPSTALCLQWLDRAAGGDGAPGLGQRTVIDYGCGSGVLGLAALLLGAGRVHAFDIDPQALLATRQNAEDNAVAGRLHVCERAEDIPRGCDVLLANILGSILQPLAPQFGALLERGARLVLAGLLPAEEAQMTAAFSPWFDIGRFDQRDGWVALSGTRH